MARHPLHPFIIQYAKTLTKNGRIVSTIHVPNYGGKELWETAVDTEPVERYDNYQQAKIGHSRHVTAHGGLKANL